MKAITSHICLDFRQNPKIKILEDGIEVTFHLDTDDPTMINKFKESLWAICPIGEK